MNHTAYTYQSGGQVAVDLTTGSPVYDPAKIQAPGGDIVVDAVRWLRRYSAALVGSAQTAQSILFKYGEGQQVAGANNGNVTATNVHTNITDEGRMDNNAAFAICRVSVEFAYDIARATIGAMLDSVFYEFYIGGKNPLLDGLGRQWPSGIGLWGQAGTTVFQNGRPAADNYYELPYGHELAISPGTQYRVEQSFPAGSLSLGVADTLVRMVWDGWGVEPING
jgi:hypothetical protein